MRITILHPRMDVKGGAENIVIWLAEALAARGHELAILTEVYDWTLWPNANIPEGAVRLLPRRYPARLIRSKPIRMWARARHCARMLGNSDVVITQHFPSYCWATEGRRRLHGQWRVAWLCQEPIRMYYGEATDPHLFHQDRYTPAGVENPHLAADLAYRVGFVERRARKIARNKRRDSRAWRLCDAILTNSAFMKGCLETLGLADVSVCHLGVPLTPERDHVHGDYIAVLTTLARIKNVENVIRAVARVRSQPGCGDVALRIAGRGDQRENLEALTKSCGVADAVRFEGRIDDRETADFYRNARMVVYTPIDEPFGLVPLEALVQKTPVIVSDHGGPAETITDGATGIHVNPFDPAAIADAIQRLWTDSTLCRRMGEHGRHSAETAFAMDTFIDRFEALAVTPFSG